MNSEWYMDFIKREVERHEEAKFTGSVGFQINFKEGSIGNVNVEQRKSVRMPS